MHLSTSTFAIILLFRATLAQSAPYMYQDSNEDEEALIDRLASLAAAVGSQQFSKHGYQNYDIPQMAPGGFGDLNEDLTKEYLAKLPGQFAYTPNDFRFYLPAEQFPNIPKSDKADLPQFRTPKQELERESVRQENEINPTFSANNHFMKKNEIKQTEPAQHEQNIISGPSNFMSSDHSVEKPYHSLHPLKNEEDSFSYSDIYYIGLIAGCSAAVVIALVGAGIFWYRIHQRVKAAADVDYPAYGVTGPSKIVSPSGDRKLEQSAQMYHYQHQKQQMAALQKGVLQGDRQGSAGSDDNEESDDNEDEMDYTVYECPGLAPAGEMEVKNPLFQDEATPATPQVKPEDDK